MTKLHDLANLGQSIWLDFIRRSFILDGSLNDLIGMGVMGLTSNPTIFEKAIANSTDYDDDIIKYVFQGLNINEIFTKLAISDIRSAADVFRPIYERTGGKDGYVSLEVNPLLANDSETTLAEALDLWGKVNRPNLMIKIPATPEGLPAIKEAISSGINVNVTLIFSLKRYNEVMEAYISGLEKRLAAGKSIRNIHSVASFFISRLDSKLDKMLDGMNFSENKGFAYERLKGKAAVANARLAYQLFKETFSTDRFISLQGNGANPQRPLWASTSTKNPAYSDILYIKELIGPYTVNTVPQDTLEAFLNHGEVTSTIENSIPEAQDFFKGLEDLGISIEKITSELETEGVASFANSFKSLMQTLGVKRRHILLNSGRKLRGSISMYAPETAAEKFSIQKFENTNVLERIYKKDYSVWGNDPKEIANRLDWLTSPTEYKQKIDGLMDLLRELLREEYQHAVVLGMGGSSLAPELFSRVFPTGKDSISVLILDSTQPQAVLAVQEKIVLEKTVFIVSTKSGTTEETLSFFRYFYNLMLNQVGKEKVGRHFIAITDPGSPLIPQGESLGFRRIFLNNPNIGGRFSVFSYFGLVPAALAGINLEALILQAEEMKTLCSPNLPLIDNPAVRLGVLLGELARTGRNKLTFLLPPAIKNFGDWVEQLIAESTGKAGRGLLPVLNEEMKEPELYADDRVFINFELPDQKPVAIETQDDLIASGHPIIQIPLQSEYSLGGQFFLWELITSIVGYSLEINPFDQPNVESAKVKAREMVKVYKTSGRLPEEKPLISSENLKLYWKNIPEGDGKIETDVTKTIERFLNGLGKNGYLSLQAFIQPMAGIDQALMKMRITLERRYGAAVTVGYGPRFLHSTGQLHKGDQNKGLYIQLTSDVDVDLPIPNEIGSQESDLSFGVLILAQAIGDFQALVDAERRAIRIHITKDVALVIEKLASSLANG